MSRDLGDLDRPSRNSGTESYNLLRPSATNAWESSGRAINHAARVMTHGAELHKDLDRLEAEKAAAARFRGVLLTLTLTLTLSLTLSLTLTQLLFSGGELVGIERDRQAQLQDMAIIRHDS